MPRASRRLQKIGTSVLYDHKTLFKPHYRLKCDLIAVVDYTDHPSNSLGSFGEVNVSYSQDGVLHTRKCVYFVL